MVAVANPALRIEPVPDTRQRLITVRFDLDMGGEDFVAGGEIVERALVRGVDLHDSPTRPEQFEMLIEAKAPISELGYHQRELSTTVDRRELDVQQDWWRTDHGGGVEPIIEMADHLVAEITVLVDGEVVAMATTPIVTGSWGVLGRD